MCTSSKIKGVLTEPKPHIYDIKRFSCLDNFSYINIISQSYSSYNMLVKFIHCVGFL